MVDALEAGAAAVVPAVPVTDTVKESEDGLLGETIDREGLVSVTSPLVLPATVVAGLDDLEFADLPALVVRKGSGVPGGGWFDPSEPGDPIALWQAEVARCHDYPWKRAIDPRLLRDLDESPLILRTDGG